MRQEIENGWLDFDPNFLSNEEAWSIYNELYLNTKWAQGKIRIFGRLIDIPRQEAFHSLNGQNYGYSGQQLKTEPFSPLLIDLLGRIEDYSNYTFNSVLINLYRDGQDSNGWHADNEPELGINPVIASLSLGAERNFDLKHNLTKEKIRYSLNHGSLLIMGGEVQHYWKHQIAKSAKISQPRINLTFRKII